MNYYRSIILLFSLAGSLSGFAYSTWMARSRIVLFPDVDSLSELVYFLEVAHSISR